MLRANCSTLRLKKAVCKLDHDTHIITFPWISLYLGYSLCSTGRPLLSPWERVYHPSSVSLHYRSRGSSRYEMSSLRHAHTHTAHASCTLLTHKPLSLLCCRPIIIYSSRPHSSQSLYPFSSSSGHLASYCLIYLWLSVTGQWEFIVSLNLSLSLPHLLSLQSLLLSTHLSFFLVCPFVRLSCTYLLFYVLSSSLIPLNPFFYFLTLLRL